MFDRICLPEVYLEIWIYKKKMFLEILQNSQENTCVAVSFLIQLQIYC